MALNRASIHDRELNKFVESPTRPGEPAVEVTGDVNAVPSPFAPPTNTDFISRSVSANVETYLYKAGGPSGTILKTVVLTYVLDDLEDLLTAEVT